MEVSLKDKAIKGVTWTFLGTFANKVIQFVITLILARLLTPADYGLLGMIGFFVGLASTFIDCGFTQALIQYKDRVNKDYNTVFYTNLGMSAIMYGIMYFSAPYISSFYNQAILTPIIRLYCLSFILGALSGINSVKLSIDLDFKSGNIIGTVSALLSGLIGVVCALCGLGVWSLIVQLLSSQVIRGILLLKYTKWYPTLEFSIVSFKRFFSYGSKLLIGNLIHSAYSQIYPLVIGKQFNARDLGYVTRAQGFNDVAAATINQVLASVAFPIFVRAQDDDERLMSMYDRYMQISSFALFPIILFMCGVAKPMILFLLTDKWAPSIVLLQILSVGFIWDGLIRINLNLLYVKGRTDLVLKLEIIKKAIAFSIVVISVWIGNLFVFCVGMSLYSTIAMYLNTYYTKKLLNFGFKKQMIQLWPYMSKAILIMIISLLFSNLITNSLLSLCASCVICIPLYIYLCYRERLYAFVQMVQYIGPKLGKVGTWMLLKIEK